MQDDQSNSAAPQAIVTKGRGISIIWIVPIVALLIGGWLALKAWSEQGPVITIAFETAEGLEAGKTSIRAKDVEIGKVKKINLNDDLSGVIVTAEMNRSVEKYMRDNTDFWVVRARVAAGEVSGLGTLLSGAYIGCSPSDKGSKVSHFKGLEKPPIITEGLPGRHFILQTRNLGSLDVSSPVYYRGIKVGQVVAYDFDDNAESVNVKVFVNAPYHEKVRRNSRFWNASGVDFKLDTEGVSLDTQSLISVLLGGIAFDLPNYLEPVEQARDGEVFRLYKNRETTEERFYTVKRHYLMYFDQNVRGLVPGAPVEIRGIHIGEVLDIKLEVDVEQVDARVAVYVVVEPERIDVFARNGATLDMQANQARDDAYNETLRKLVEKGLRAQLKTGNLLTGQLYVDLDFYPAAAPAELQNQDGYLVLPTLPAPFEQIAQRVNNILKTLEKMPLEEIGNDLRKAIASLDQTLRSAENVAGGLNSEVIPELKQTLASFQKTLDGVQQTLGPNSVLNHDVHGVMNEITATIRSLRSLIDYVDRNPQSILFGKEAE